jgi:hypothetical protein
MSTRRAFHLLRDDAVAMIAGGTAITLGHAAVVRGVSALAPLTILLGVTAATGGRAWLSRRWAASTDAKAPGWASVALAESWVVGATAGAALLAGALTAPIAVGAWVRSEPAGALVGGAAFGLAVQLASAAGRVQASRVIARASLGQVQPWGGVAGVLAISASASALFCCCFPCFPAVDAWTELWLLERCRTAPRAPSG